MATAPEVRDSHQKGDVDGCPRVCLSGAGHTTRHTFDANGNITRNQFNLAPELGP